VYFLALINILLIAGYVYPAVLNAKHVQIHWKMDAYHVSRTITFMKALVWKSALMVMSQIMQLELAF
jgi:hypothetical protein